MTKRIGGIKRKSRSKLTKSYRARGKLSLQRFFQSFEVGARVQLSAEPSVQDGMYATRFYGKMGTVKGKQGKCYTVEIKDGNKEKTIIVHPVHLTNVR